MTEKEILILAEKADIIVNGYLVIFITFQNSVVHFFHNRNEFSQRNIGNIAAIHEVQVQLTDVLRTLLKAVQVRIGFLFDHMRLRALTFCCKR